MMTMDSVVQGVWTILYILSPVGETRCESISLVKERGLFHFVKPLQ